MIPSPLPFSIHTGPDGPVCHLVEPPRNLLPEAKECWPIDLCTAASFSSFHRQWEFLWGRWLTKRALAISAPIDYDAETRRPIWPKGWAGSISHKAGIIATIGHPCNQSIPIGIDLEIPDRVNSKIEKKVCLQSESTLISQLEAPDMPRVTLLTLAFSFKEAIYKRFNPSWDLFFGFESAEISHIDFRQGTISATATHPKNKERLPVKGRFAFGTSPQGIAYILTMTS